MSTVAEVQEAEVASPLIFTDNAAKKVCELIAEEGDISDFTQSGIRLHAA